MALLLLDFFLKQDWMSNILKRERKREKTYGSAWGIWSQATQSS